jgi:hypothetical protein
MKKCSKCQCFKEMDCFCKNKRSSDGYNWTCKLCVNLTTKSSDFKEKRKKRYHSKRPIRKYSEKSRVRKSEYDKAYREDNKKKIATQKKLWESNKRNDPKYKATRNVRRRINHALHGRNKSFRTFELLGCDIDFFMSHIEHQFLDGMSWDNYGQWHIDHIVECFRFDLSDPQQQKICFHYSNQRPLWAKDNLTRRRNQQTPIHQSPH